MATEHACLLLSHGIFPQFRSPELSSNCCSSGQ